MAIATRIIIWDFFISDKLCRKGNAKHPQKLAINRILPADFNFSKL